MTTKKTPNTKELVNPLRMVTALESIAESLDRGRDLDEVVTSLDRISSELHKTNRWLEEIASQQTDILTGRKYRTMPPGTPPQPGERIRPTRVNHDNWFRRVFKQAQINDSKDDD